MHREEVLRLAFIQDVEEVMERLYQDIAHIDQKEADEEIIHLLYALRLAAISYDERYLKKKIEKTLAAMLNRREHQTEQMVTMLYDLADAIVYPVKYTALAS